MSTRKKVSPLCLGTPGSVRTTRMPQSVRCAQLDQTFCPLTIQSPDPSPARTALVRSPARSDPAAGSEKSWHQVMSPLSVASMKRAFCASPARSEEHTSELQSLMRISYAVFCLKKKTKKTKKKKTNRKHINNKRKKEAYKNTHIPN